MAAAVIAVLLAGALAWGIARHAPAPSPPSVDLVRVDPAVAEAVESAGQAVRQAPRSAAAWGRLGMVLRAHDFGAEANICFAQAERLDPKEPRWPYLQALTLLLGDPDAGIDKLERVVTLAGDLPGPRLRLAEELLGKGRLEEAEQHFRQVLADEPENPRAHLGLGRLAYWRGEFPDSLAHLQRSDPGLPHLKAAHLLLAEVYRRLNQKEAADKEADLAEHMEDDPGWFDPFVDEVERLQVGTQARITHADQLDRQGRQAEAVALLRRTVEERPESAPAWLALGQTLNRLQQGSEAETVLRQAVALAPRSPEARFQLGVAHFLQDNYDAALQCFRQTIDLKPSDALAHYNVGYCLMQRDRGEEAIAALRAALSLRPDYGPAHANLGKLLAQQGHDAEALRHLEYARRFSPKDPESRKLLQELRERVGAPRKP